jgi:pimeloyl-ACP methyl ester carboxylesterase
MNPRAHPAAATSQIELSAGTIEYEDTGGDGPAIVLLPGLMMDASLWEGVIADLSPGHRCVAPTLPMGAHRRAMHADADLSPRGLAGLVSELLDRLDLNDVTLVGNDTGGALVQLLAAEGAARVGRIVLVSCDAFDNFPPGLTGKALVLIGNSAHPVRPLHAADAVPAAQAASDRLRLADDAWGRRDQALDGTWLEPWSNEIEPTVNRRPVAFSSPSCRGGIDVADNRGQRCRLARAGRRRAQDEAALLFRQGRHAVGQLQLRKRRYVGRDEPEGERDRPALAEAVDAEARKPWRRVREVELAGLVERSPARRVVARDGVQHILQLLLTERRPHCERGEHAVPT